MRIEIGFGTLGRWENVAVVLSSLMTQTYENWDLTIIDDSPSPVDLRDSHSAIANFFKLMEEKGHRWQVFVGAKKGPQWARQKILDNSRSPLTWIIDDDFFFMPNTMEILHDVFRDKKVGCAGALIWTPGTPRNFLPPNWKEVKELNGKVLPWIGYGCDQHYVIHASAPNIKEVEHLCGSVMFRTSIGKKWGWNLNLSRFGYTCENEFTYRFFKSNYKCLLVPEAIMFHFQTPDALSKRSKEFDTETYKDRMQFMDKVKKWALGAYSNER